MQILQECKIISTVHILPDKSFKATPIKQKKYKLENL